jgi:hypothetical protein
MPVPSLMSCWVGPSVIVYTACATSYCTEIVQFFNVIVFTGFFFYWQNLAAVWLLELLFYKIAVLSSELVLTLHFEMQQCFCAVWVQLW